MQAWLDSLSQGTKPGHDVSADVPQAYQLEEGSTELQLDFKAVIWRGLNNSALLEGTDDLRPGDTLVCPALAGGWLQLGFVPDIEEPDFTGFTRVHSNKVDKAGLLTLQIPSDKFWQLAKIDQGNLAFYQSRRRPIIRCHPALVSHSVLVKIQPDGEKLSKSGLTKSVWEDFKTVLADDAPGRALCQQFCRDIRIAHYPDDENVVFTGLPELYGSGLIEDHEVDSYSRLDAGEPVPLQDHLEAVREMTEHTVSKLALSRLEKTFELAAIAHDWGKADERFQAMLFGGDVFQALASTKLYAKSSSLKTNKYSSQFASTKSGIPRFFRHELLSSSLLEKAASMCQGVEDEALLHHLVASHHGYARPWVNICKDDNPPPVNLSAIGLDAVSLSVSERQAICYCRVDAPVSERFWYGNSTYGWWGLAYLEAVLRMADQFVSWKENQRQRVSRPLEKSAMSDALGREISHV